MDVALRVMYPFEFENSKSILTYVSGNIENGAWSGKNWIPKSISSFKVNPDKVSATLLIPKWYYEKEIHRRYWQY